jgi:hypothetical protein
MKALMSSWLFRLGAQSSALATLRRNLEKLAAASLR